MNNTVLVGRITKDPTLNKTTGGFSTLGFTLAVNRKFKKEGQPEADFISCVALGKTAEFMANYVKKGSLLGVEGRIQTRSYKDKNEKTVFITEVVCDSVQILSSKNGNSVDNSKDDEFVDTLNVTSDELPF
ncbi:single-stranded DNA-binding protein [Methanobrevibacter sp.]|uniref:single-stranded DNA-binding protein n=1 Tax=Methanobrevibacter sp. TaxID=66852 RepID=UPI00388CF696